MILFTTVSSSLNFAEKHPDIVERFLKGMIEGIHFFKTQPERAAKIISSRNARGGPIPVDVAPLVQRTLASALEPKLFPTPAAIANVYQEGIRADADAKRVNPMELWDLHYIRRIDDSGFVDDLYANSGKAAPAG
jgi:ABC-type nitrate/sulfonate/bicarbonate transport system substrate-binding protein